MLRTSETVKEVFGALVKFNTTFKGLTKDATNPFFKNNYISFDSIVGLRNDLAKEGLVMIQSVGGPEDGSYATIVTTIAHISGEWIESDPLTVKPVKTDPQALGSAISYGKRYQSAAMLGIAEVTDDDGNTATGTKNTPPVQSSFNQVAQNPRPVQPQSTPSQNPAAQPSGMSEQQMQRMGGLLKSKGMNREKAIEICKAVTGKTATSQLTQAEGELLIKAYEEYQA